jgi:hypothetical protein
MGSLFSRVSGPTEKASASISTSTKMGPLAFSHFAKAQKDFKPPLIANENAYLGDVHSR